MSRITKVKIRQLQHIIILRIWIAIVASFSAMTYLLFKNLSKSGPAKGMIASLAETPVRDTVHVDEQAKVSFSAMNNLHSENLSKSGPAKGTITSLAETPVRDTVHVDKQAKVSFSAMDNSLSENLSKSGPAKGNITSLAETPVRDTVHVDEQAEPTPSYEEQLWSGEALRSQFHVQDDKHHEIQNIEIAVEFCKSNLRWLMKSIYYELPKRSSIKITLLSKCGNEKKVHNFTSIPNVKNVEILTLPNKGGCDLAFAHFINQYIARENSEAVADTVIFFLKDTKRTRKNCHQKGKYRSLQEMLRVSSQGNFVCGVKLRCDWSPFHDTRLLRQFSKNSYRRHGDKAKSNQDFNAADYKNLEDFIHGEFTWTFPNDEVTEVCYGGSFAVPAKRLFADQRLKQVFNKLESILVEGSSMQVAEHFAERLWASWLSIPVNRTEIDILYDWRLGIRTENGRYMGMLFTDNDSTC